MRDTPERHRNAADRTVKDIRRKTRRRHSTEEKIRIVIERIRGKARDLKEALAEQMLENQLLNKSMIGDGKTRNEVSRIREI